MELTATIPLKNIKKIQIYQNKSRLYMKYIKEKTGADYIINGTIYNPSRFTSYGNTKFDGVVLHNPGYTEWGYMWNTGEDIKFGVLPNSTYRNYIGCVGMKKGDKLYYNSDMGGKRQRSCIGIKGNNLMLYCCNGVHSKTPETLQKYVYNNGWSSAIMLDGGGSTQCIFDNNILNSTENNGNGRIVQNYILIFLEGNNVDTHPNTTDNKITVTPMSKTGTVNCSVLNVRNGPGTSNYSVIGTLSKNTKVEITGYYAPTKWYQIKYNGINGYVYSSYIDIPVVETDNKIKLTSECPYTEPKYAIYKGTGEGVKWVQWHMNVIVNAGLVIDGSYGPATKAAVKTFQQKYGLEVDGSCGHATRAKIKSLVY